MSPATSMVIRTVKECIEHWRHGGQSQAREGYDGFARGAQDSFKAEMIQRCNRMRLYATWQCSNVQISVGLPRCAKCFTALFSPLLFYASLCLMLVMTMNGSVIKFLASSSPHK